MYYYYYCWAHKQTELRIHWLSQASQALSREPNEISNLLPGFSVQILKQTRYGLCVTYIGGAFREMDSNAGCPSLARRKHLGQGAQQLKLQIGRFSQAELGWRLTNSRQAGKTRIVSKPVRPELNTRHVAVLAQLSICSVVTNIELYICIQHCDLLTILVYCWIDATWKKYWNL